MSLLSFPTELQLLTLKRLSFRDLLHCRTLCKHFHTLVDTSRELAFIKEFGASGVKDNENCLVPRKKKIEFLWKSNIAWANLHWLCRRQIQLAGSGSLFDVSGGLFFHTTKPSNTSAVNGTIIEWFKLPSRREPNPGYAPQRITYNTALVEFAVDTPRDLVIGLELTNFKAKRYYTMLCNLYPKTISTNVAHPSAAQHVLSCRFVSPNPNFHLHMELCGNHIGVLLTRPVGIRDPDSFDMFLLLDWTTGVTKATMRTYGLEECWETFCFLSTESILIPSARNSLLNIYHFDNNPNSLRHDISLLLPEPLRREGLRHIYVRSQSFSGESSHLGHPTGDNPPFTVDPDEAVVILQLDYRYHMDADPDDIDYGHNLPQVVAIPRHVLNRYAQLARRDDPQLMSSIECSHGRHYPDKSSLSAALRAFPPPCCVHEQLYECFRNDAHLKRFPHLHPEQWIQNTRWGIDSVTPTAGCFAYGSRYLGMSSRSTLPNAPASSITLYDFNLRNERRGFEDLLDEENVRPYPPPDEEFNEDEDWDYDERTGQKRWPVLPSQIVTTPSTVSVPEVFKSSFTTALPYRVTESEMVLPWDSAIIDGERIIGLEYADSEIGSINTLDILVI